MEHERPFTRVTPFVLALSLALVSGCGGSGEETRDIKTSVPPNAEGTSQPGRLTIKAATASSGAESAAFVFDHDLERPWNSGSGVPGWIQLDLGQPTAITKVRLYTEQSPPGPTSHQILGGLSPDSLVPLGALDGDTDSRQWLELQVKENVRYVRIVTLKSPSWVAWREVEIYE